MRTPDLDRARSEKKLTLPAFMKAYNENLPVIFPHASLPLLKTFRKTYPALFKDGAEWSLEVHRKRVMDWLPAHLKSFEV